ncbi:MAG: hypothetical protein EZS28_026649 [Streblomastix strix]|uniref:Uncharacterized protein n=1 Tax=Streblomastix strix TaxID=222440 RepID=A0A5J4V611_9EUKA|nr:MAG: hypothetical protein EZS28_026649 [Streblomastix strix]
MLTRVNITVACVTMKFHRVKLLRVEYVNVSKDYVIEIIVNIRKENQTISNIQRRELMLQLSGQVAQQH